MSTSYLMPLVVFRAELRAVARRPQAKLPARVNGKGEVCRVGEVASEDCSRAARVTDEHDGHLVGESLQDDGQRPGGRVASVS